MLSKILQQTGKSLKKKSIRWASSLSFVSSPETATGSVPIQEYLSGDSYKRLISFQNDGKNNYMQEQLELSPSILSPETATGFTPIYEFLDYQHVLLYHQSKKEEDLQPIPKTLQDALGNRKDPRAIVVTKARDPFSIIDVNDAWENMCGFSREEAKKDSLALIQGPETNKEEVKAMIHDLREGYEATAIVTNYTKTGRKFRNYVRAGPIFDAQNHITHFVGVLQELTEPSNDFQIAL